MTKLQIARPSSARVSMRDFEKEFEHRVAAGTSHCPVVFAEAFLALCMSQSCGKCTPCRIGLEQLSRLIGRVLDGKGDRDELAVLERTAQDIYLSADCSIGFEAAQAIFQSVRGFRDDYEHHVAHGSCGFDEQGAVPCVTGCPAGVDIPGYISLVQAGRYADAVGLIRKDNPFPLVCGLVCEHPCETKCRRGMVDDPINIRALKRYAADHERDACDPCRHEPTGKRIAIVGGGPAGLSAAYYLALMGHSPTVFEQRDHLGGMMRYGIPSYRLPREDLDREIAWIISKGAKEICGVSVPADISFEKLRGEYDAVYLAIGAHADKKLGVEGEDSEGVLSAMQMLRAIGDGVHPDFSGKRIVVVGGGNVAMDVARSSIRLGAEHVTIAYRRRIEDMTARREEIEGAIAEGCELLELHAPLTMLSTEGILSGIEVRPQIIGQIEHGRPKPRNAAGGPVVVACDRVLVAIGQDVDSSPFAELGIPVERGRILVDEYGSVKGMEGVFAGGDCETGPSTVIRAIAAGKAAARAIDEYLGFDHDISVDIDIPHAQGGKRLLCARSNTGERPPLERIRDFKLMETGLSSEAAAQESSRCLRCDKFGFGAFRGGRLERW